MTFPDGSSGWGLKTLGTKIRTGSIITEYVGRLLTCDEARAEGVNQQHHCAIRDGTGRVLYGINDPAVACTFPNSAFGSFVNGADHLVPGDKDRVNCYLAAANFVNGPVADIETDKDVPTPARSTRSHTAVATVRESTINTRSTVRVFLCASMPILPHTDLIIDYGKYAMDTHHMCSDTE